MGAAEPFKRVALLFVLVTKQQQQQTKPETQIDNFWQFRKTTYSEMFRNHFFIIYVYNRHSVLWKLLVVALKAF